MIAVCDAGGGKGNTFNSHQPLIDRETRIITNPTLELVYRGRVAKASDRQQRLRSHKRRRGLEVLLFKNNEADQRRGGKGCEICVEGGATQINWSMDVVDFRSQYQLVYSYNQNVLEVKNL